MSDKAAINDIGTGFALYIVERDGTGQAWNGSTFATETTTRSTFAIGAAEIGTTGHYTATIPGSAGFRRRTWYKQLSGSPLATDTPLGIEEGYWSGSALDHLAAIDASIPVDTNAIATAVATALNGLVTILPVVSTVSTGEVSDGSITQYQYAKFGPFNFTINDSAASPINLSGHSITFVVYTLKGSFAWEIANCGVSGTGHNIVTVSGNDTYTQNEGTFRYVLRNVTADTVIARGSLNIERDVDAQ